MDDEIAEIRTVAAVASANDRAAIALLCREVFVSLATAMTRVGMAHFENAQMARAVEPSSDALKLSSGRRPRAAIVRICVA